MRELRNKPQVRGLVQNPLLLSLICSLYQEKGLTLPARRAQVYEKAVAYMLVKWSKEKREPRKGEEDWADLKSELLEDLAYQFSCEDTEVFSRRDLRRKIDQYLRDEDVPSEFKSVTASDLLVELTEQDGILQKLNSEDDQYLFLHRTFQEYLTACYVARAKDGITLTKAHFWEYDWHETIILMAGLMKKPLVLIEAIAAEKDDIFQTQLLLAGRCIAECSQISDPLINKLIDRIYQFWQKYPNAEFIRSVVVAIGQTSTKLVQALQTALTHKDSHVRGRAARALGRIGSEKAVDALLLILSDPDSGVRGSAAEALGQMGSEKAVEALIRALSASDSDVRSRAAPALRQIGSEKAVEALILALSASDSDVRNRAASALGQIGSEKAVEALIRALSDPEFNVRDSAASALGQIGSEKAVEALILALSDPDHYCAAEALGQIGSEKAVEALIRVLSDPDPYSEIRRYAASALGQIRSEKAVEVLVLTLSDQDIDVRSRAAEALGQIGSEKAVEALVLALSYPDSYVRRSAAAALGQIGSAASLEKLLQCPNINLDTTIFFLVRRWAIRFSKSGSPCIPVYPEVVERYRTDPS